MSQLTLYLMLGYPGAGKTTVSQLIAEQTGATHLWADAERRQMFDQPTHSHEENVRLYRKLNARAEELLAQGKSVIFDTNFNFYKDRQHLREIAARQGAEVLLIWITTPKEVARQRAVEDSHGRDTRLYGNMSTADFERLAGQLEPPAEDEKFIKIDGTKLDEAAVVRLISQ